ncbi:MULTISPECIES: nucleoside/nucleotide kinase family protein [Silvimonas]|uniref:nucleoside/nucleotide kinase family protein n=1 Tax=Silvimonas TaxID=300264 RepID=UPI0024B344DF|nr:MULTISPECIES: nucleoside/nucleotide kinase family protein [Silvimonas]MDR3428390.1 nucleoside/nucleotide kinase family protein [Silvimonas sp.]
MVPDIYLQRALALLESGQRKILGIAGAPGSGKSTVAQALAEQLGARAIVVPMDGYHLANVELARLGRASRKGAPDTFDMYGYVALLQRLKQQGKDETVYAPLFRREIEEPIAGAIPVAADIPLIITEGNYLLMENGGWQGVRPLLDEAWYVGVDDELRRSRLAARHMHFGRSEQAAKDWVANTDEPNAVRIAATQARADLIVQWPEL